MPSEERIALHRHAMQMQVIMAFHRKTVWKEGAYTANVFPIKSVGKPRVTRGTP